MSAEDVGNAAAGFHTSLKIPMGDMEKYFDLINGLADSGIADEKDIVDFVDRTGATLKNFGLANNDIAALGSTLLDLKMPADVAARAMNTVSTKLLTPKGTDKSAAAFAVLYGNADKFTKLLKTDARTALIDFLERVQKLDKFKQASVLSGILGQGFSDEVQRLSGGLDEFLRNLKYADGQQWFGSLGKSYKMQLDTLNSQWQVAKNQLGDLTITVGLAGMPALEAGMKEIQGFLDEFRVEVGARQEAKKEGWSTFEQIAMLGLTPEQMRGMAWAQGVRTQGDIQLVDAYGDYQNKRMEGLAPDDAGGDLPPLPKGRDGPAVAHHAAKWSADPDLAAEL